MAFPPDPVTIKSPINRFQEYRRKGEAFLKNVHHDPEATIGALLTRIESLEKRLDEQTKINNSAG